MISEEEAMAKALEVGNATNEIGEVTGEINEQTSQEAKAQQVSEQSNGESPEQTLKFDGGEDDDMEAGGFDEVSETVGESERPNALVSMDEVRRMSVYKDWIVTLDERIPEGVTIDEHGNMMISSDAEDSDIGIMAKMFSECDLRSNKMSMASKRFIAVAVSELSTRHDSSPAEVIDELGLCDGTGRSFDTVYSWCKAFAELPDECFYPNLTMSHLVRASRVGKPKDAKALKTFNKKRAELLRGASLDPDGVSAKQIERELMQITSALDKRDKQTMKRESTGVIMDRLVEDLRVYKLAGVDPEILERNGITMADLVNQIEVDEHELSERGKIIEDAANIILHWTDAPTVDV